MDRLIYTAVSGMADSMIRQGAIASNLANSQTIGFRAETFDSTPVAIRSPSSLDVRTMVSTGVLGADMTAGSIVETGRGLDLAVEGEALLAVQATRRLRSLYPPRRPLGLPQRRADRTATAAR